MQTSLTHGTLTLLQIGLALMVAACQSKPVLPEMDAIEANDKTLVLNGCSTSIDKGVQVCRFVEGSPMNNNLHIIFPWNDAADMVGEIRLRVGQLVVSKAVASKTVSIAYSDIFQSKTWEPQHDGPIQILGSFGFAKDGGVRRSKVLGYLYVIVLKKGYSPLPVFWTEAFSAHTCKIMYAEDGRSSVFCQ